jgi:hypothetical protein
MRILGMLRADKESEAGTPPSKELMERMGVFIGEVMQAGVLLATDGLHPSVKGKRVKLENGKMTVTDGPFTESKELVASYALFQVNSMDEAVMWTKRFLECLGEGQCELRPIFEPTDFSSDLISPEQIAREETWRKDMDQKLARR